MEKVQWDSINKTKWTWTIKKLKVIHSSQKMASSIAEFRDLLYIYSHVTRSIGQSTNVLTTRTARTQHTQRVHTAYLYGTK